MVTHDSKSDLRLVELHSSQDEKKEIECDFRKDSTPMYVCLLSNVCNSQHLLMLLETSVSLA